jgi:hypothetical protein
MNSSSAFTRSITLLALSVAVLASHPALARERHTGVTGPNAKTATRDVSRAHGDVSSSTSGAQGKALASRNVDRSAGSTTGSLTGPQGNSATRETTRTETGSNTLVTGPNGQTGSVAVTR